MLLTKAVDLGGAGGGLTCSLVSTFALGRLTSREYATGGRLSVSRRLSTDFGDWRRSEIVIRTAAGNIPSCVESHWLSFVVPSVVVSTVDVPPLVVPSDVVLLPAVPPEVVPPLAVPPVPP